MGLIARARTAHGAMWISNAIPGFTPITRPVLNPWRREAIEYEITDQQIARVCRDVLDLARERRP